MKALAWSLPGGASRDADSELVRVYTAEASITMQSTRRPTCGGQHRAGEKQGRGEVPVPVSRGVVEDGDPIVAGLQGFLQEPLQPLLGETVVLLEELSFDGPQLLTQEVFIRQLHGGENHGPEN